MRFFKISINEDSSIENEDSLIEKMMILGRPGAQVLGNVCDYVHLTKTSVSRGSIFKNHDASIEIDDASLETKDSSFENDNVICDDV